MMAELVVNPKFTFIDWNRVDNRFALNLYDV